MKLYYRVIYNHITMSDMDSTSFASVLAGVKRMRGEYEEGERGGEGERSEETGNKDGGNEGNKQTKEGNKQKDQSKGIMNQTSKETELKKHKSNTPTTNSSTPTTHSNVPKSSVPSRDAIKSRIRLNVQMYSEIQVSKTQKGNPLLNGSFMKTTPWVFNSNVLSDYYINPTFQILFLSLQYYKLHPEYIWTRLKRFNQGSSIPVKRDNSLKVLLVVIDIDSHQDYLRKLNDICIRHDLSMILAWSFEEAGNYVAMCKQYELSANKIHLSIKGVKNSNYSSNLIEALTSVKSINKTDVVNLIATYGSFKNVVTNSNDIAILGLGQRKMKNLQSVFNEPFILNKVDQSDNEHEDEN